jgi:hypothetical protein
MNLPPQLLAHDYVILGRQLERLGFATGTIESLDELRSSLRVATDQLKRLGFHKSEAAARRLIIFRRQLDELEGKLPRPLEPETIRELRGAVFAVFEVLNAETMEQHIAILDRSSVSELLRTTEHRLKHPVMKIIAQEAIKNLESEATRSALVMAWNLTYEYIRQWIYVDSIRRGAFNAALVKRVKKGATIYSALTEYEDMYDLGEHFVLTVGNEAVLADGKKLLPDRKYNELIQELAHRNNFAHPNAREASVVFVKGYVEGLINGFILDGYFVDTRLLS